MIPAYERKWAGPLLDRYNRYLLRKSFARIRVAGLDVARSLNVSTIFAPNHSCWWDGCVDLYLSRRVMKRRSLLMMSDEQLRKYRIFSSMGVFAGGPRYAANELKRHPGTQFWIYPQGEMLPARVPLDLREGVLLISEMSGAPVVPVAQRFEFLRDDHPEIIVRIGTPIEGLTRRDGTSRLREAMSTLLQQVDSDIASTRFDAYESILTGAETRSDQLDRLRESRA